MNQDYTVTRAKHLKTLRTFLKRWREGTARLWEFQAAHCHLTIRIERSGEHGDLHVICLGPEFIHGLVQWDDCAFEVHLESDQFGETERYEVNYGCQLPYELQLRKLRLINEQVMPQFI